MVKQTFSASIKKFALKTETEMRNVMRESVQDVIEDAQLPRAKGGRMRVDTGFLRNSMASGLNGSLGNPSGKADPQAAASAASYELTIAQMDLGDTAQFAWTAEYAYVREMLGDNYVGGAAIKWKSFVAKNAKRRQV